jgi:hypothetical protein
MALRRNEKRKSHMTWRRAILLLAIGLAIGLIVSMRH